MWICVAPCREHISKALRFGTRSQGISQFYLHTPRSYLSNMNQIRFSYNSLAKWPCIFSIRTGLRILRNCLCDRSSVPEPAGGADSASQNLS